MHKVPIPQYTTCPHCQRKFTVKKHPAHVKRCPMNPAMFDLQRSALDDGTGYIRGMNDYHLDTRGGCTCATLRGAFLTWAAVAEYYGLKFASHAERISASRKRQPIGLKAPLAPHERLRTMPTPEQEIAAYRMRDTLYTPHGCPACQVVEDEREVRWVLR